MQTKLQDVEVRLKRWHTRLTRASNEVARLEKKRRRLTLEALSEGREVVATVGVAKKKEVAADPVEVKRQVDAAIESAIPDFLDRSDPLIAERMTAARKKAEEAERHRMPLSGRDALKAIRAERKRKKD